MDPVFPSIPTNSNIFGPSRSLREPHPFPSYQGKGHKELPSCPAKASAVVYPRSKEVLSWQAAGFQASGSSYRGVKDAVPWLKEFSKQYGFVFDHIVSSFKNPDVVKCWPRFMQVFMLFGFLLSH